MLDLDITQLVPHRKPALLVDGVLELFPEGMTTAVSWPEGEGTPLLLIEAAAQSVAAYQGKVKTGQGEAVTEGFLVGVRDFSLPETLPPGGAWTVRVKENKNLNPFYLFDAEVLHNGQPLAVGTLTLFERPANHAPSL